LLAELDEPPEPPELPPQAAMATAAITAPLRHAAFLGRPILCGCT
jgi:hypothetical protein